MPDSERTEPQTREEALLLWNDTLRILAQSVGNERLRAMMEACEPISLDGNLLTVRTHSGFAKHNLDASKAKILRALSKAAFEPMDLSVEFEETHWDENPKYPDLILRGVRAEVTPFPSTSPSTEPGAATTAKSSEAPTSPSPSDAIEIPSIPSAGAVPADVIPFGIAQSSLTEDEFRRQFASDAEGNRAGAGQSTSRDMRDHTRIQATFDGSLGETDSIFTFDTFVEGEENRYALMAAKQVANGGDPAQFNPLFIYGSSGLGKTHLLLSIKNYIAANDPSRLCVYRTAREFISDYTTAMAPNSDKTVKDRLEDAYRGVDVLILDDIQHMVRAVGTIEFFFDTFNYLISNKKQIVLAADVPPAELGMPERITSRMASGFPISIQAPALELRRILIQSFYRRDKADALPGYEGEISSDVLDTMAEYCGNNIRLIKAYVQQALFLASQIQRTEPGSEFTVDDAEALAKERGLMGHHNVTIDEIQSIVEHEMGVSHTEIVSNKRNKEIAQARHVAIWLCRQLTDNTYKDIGLRFGGRSHTTCLHSCEWVDDRLRQRTDRYLIDTVTTLRRRLEAL